MEGERGLSPPGSARAQEALFTPGRLHTSRKSRPEAYNAPALLTSTAAKVASKSLRRNCETLELVHEIDYRLCSYPAGRRDAATPQKTLAGRIGECGEPDLLIGGVF